MKVQQLIKDFLRMRQGQVFTALTAKEVLYEHWGLSIAWAEFVQVLDYLVSIEDARRYGGLNAENSSARYIIN